MNHRGKRAKQGYTRTRPGKPGLRSLWLSKLSYAQKELLFDWLTRDGGMTYAAARERANRQWHVNLTDHQLCTFWQRFCNPRLLQAAPAPDGEVLFELEITVKIKRQKGASFGA